ncbi:MAG: T9SS type A sorting domain-containing protein, partial [Bacteroidia bacterium]
SGATGKLRFFTNGVDVYDSTKTVMPNGSGLMGDISSTQSALVVPNPANNQQYFIFTTAADGGGDFRFSVVDMSLHGGLGDVMTASKNTFLNDSTTEKIAAIKDPANGYWIVTHIWGNNAFYSYHLTASGLVTTPVMSYVGTVHSTSAIQNTYGQMKFNMCGDKLAVAIGYQNTIEVLDFDQSTGIVSSPITISMPDHVYGVEFSKNSNLLYASCYDVSGTLVQFDISLGSLPLIMASRTPLSVTSDLYALQMGPDGKIYVSESFSSSYLGVISSPNTAGSGCSYSDLGVNLDPGFMGINDGLGLPGFMQSYLKLATGATCLATDVAENSEQDLNPVFPNPSANEFTFQTNQNEKASISIYDYTGKLVEEFDSSNSSVIHFGKGYAPGVYFLMYNNGVKIKTVKAVKM